MHLNSISTYCNVDFNLDPLLGLWKKCEIIILLTKIIFDGCEMWSLYLVLLLETKSFLTILALRMDIWRNGTMKSCGDRK